MSRSAALIAPLSFSNSPCGSKDKSMLPSLSGALQSEAWAIISHIRRLQFLSHHTKKDGCRSSLRFLQTFFIDINDNTLTRFLVGGFLKNNHLHLQQEASYQQTLITHSSGYQVAGCHIKEATAQSRLPPMWWYITWEYCGVSGSGEWKYDPTGDLYLPHSSADLDHGHNVISQISLNAGWRYAAEMRFLSLLCADAPFHPHFLSVAFKECAHCPATQKECLKWWGCGPGTRRSLRGRSRNTTQSCQVGYLSHRRCLTTESWRRTEQQVMPRTDPGLSQPETHTSIRFGDDGCQRAFGFGPLLFWDTTLFHIVWTCLKSETWPDIVLNLSNLRHI